MIGDVLNGHGISKPLYEYYEELILPLASWDEKRISFIGIDFMTLVGWLYHGLYRLKNVDPHRLNEQQLVLYKLKILNGDYGFDYMWLLKPIEASTKTEISPEGIEYREKNASEKRRQWALNSILMGGSGLEFPPM